MREILAAGLMAIAGGTFSALSDGATGAKLLRVLPWLGQQMRALSTGSQAGDILLWILYVLVSLAPVLGLFPLRRRFGVAEGLFLGASVYCFYFLRMLANPTRLLPVPTESFIPVGMTMAFAVLLSLLTGACLLRVLARHTTMAELARPAQRVVTVLAAVDGLLTGVTCTSALKQMPPEGLFLGTGVLILCQLFQTGALVWMLGGVSDLIESVRWGWFDETNVRLADSLAKRGKALLVVVVLTACGQNLSALMQMGLSQSGSVLLSLPLTEFVAAIASVLLASFVREGVRIQEENDAFV